MALEQEMLKAYEDYYTKDQSLQTFNRKNWKKGDEVPREKLEAAGLRPNALSLSGDRKVYDQREIDKLNAYELKISSKKNAELQRQNKKSLDERVNYVTKKTEELSKQVPKELSNIFQLTGDPDNSKKSETSNTKKQTEEAKTELEKLRAELKKLEESNRDAFTFEQLVEFDKKVKELKQKISDKEFMLSLDFSPAEASLDALYQKYEEIMNFMDANQDKLADDMKKNLTEIGQKIKKEITSRDFSKFGTKMLDWRRNASSDDLKKRQESLRGELRNRTPETSHSEIQSRIDQVKARIAFESDPKNIDDLKAQLAAL
jgi:hypothetical protein